MHLRTKFLRATHNSLHTMKEFLSIVMLVIYALDFQLFEFFCISILFHHIIEAIFYIAETKNSDDYIIR